MADARRNTEAMNRPGFRTQLDMARDLVRYSFNGKPAEEWLTATVSCTDMAAMGIGEQHSCSAFVTRWFAPVGKLQAMIPTFRAIKGTVNQQWMNQWTATVIRRINTMYEQQTQALLEQGKLAQEQRMQAHRDFMQSMQQGRDTRDIQFKDGQYRKQQNKEDYVDYILDCQRLYGGNTRVDVGNCQSRQTW